MEPEYVVGQELNIWITGLIGVYRARVTEVREDGPRLERLDPAGAPMYGPVLKPGDYVIRGPYREDS